MNDGKLKPGEQPFWPVAADDCGVYYAALERRVKRDVALFRGGFSGYDAFNEVCGARTCDCQTTLWEGLIHSPTQQMQPHKHAMPRQHLAC
jgi:hypothetical protein